MAKNAKFRQIQAAFEIGGVTGDGRIVSTILPYTLAGEPFTKDTIGENSLVWSDPRSPEKEDFKVVFTMKDGDITGIECTNEAEFEIKIGGMAVAKKRAGELTVSTKFSGLAIEVTDLRSLRGSPTSMDITDSRAVSGSPASMVSSVSTDSSRAASPSPSPRR